MNKLRNRVVSMFMAGMVFLTGCASIVSKSKYPVSINSVPPGAKLTITNKKGETVYSGTTPTTATLKAKSGYFSPGKYTLTLELAGYPKKTVPLKASLDGWYVGNIIFGGLLGILIVDPATGAMWRLDDSVNVSFGSTTSQTSPQLQIMEVAYIPAEWEGKLVRIN